MFRVTHGRNYKIDNSKMTLHFLLWGIFCITMLLLNVKKIRIKMPRVEGVVENWRISFFLCAFFVIRLFLNYCMWLKGGCLTCFISQQAGAGL